MGGRQIEAPLRLVPPAGNSRARVRCGERDTPGMNMPPIGTDPSLTWGRESSRQCSRRSHRDFGELRSSRENRAVIGNTVWMV